MRSSRLHFQGIVLRLLQGSTSLSQEDMFPMISLEGWLKDPFSPIAT